MTEQTRPTNTNEAAETLRTELSHWGGPSYGDWLDAALDWERRHTVEIREVLRRLVDDAECRYDHHGGCQTHGFLEPDAEEPWPCGMAHARAILTESEASHE